MLGARATCPKCTMEVRWINTWHDPIIEKESAASLFDAGAQVVLTGADTPAVADVERAGRVSTYKFDEDLLTLIKV
jgi:basic membrane protein A